MTTLVLGGSSDIGTAIASKLAGDVILAGPDPETLRVAARRFEPGRLISITTFDAAAGDHRELFEHVATQGRLDTVIAAAGALGVHDEMLEHPEDADALATINYTGTANALLHAARTLNKNGGGTIIVVSSAAGQRIRGENFIYGASKAAIDAFARGLRQQYPQLRVLVVRPGFVESKMTAGLAKPPLASTPEQVAEKTVRALENGKSIVWIPGSLRWVILVGSLLPDGIWQKLTAVRRR